MRRLDKMAAELLELGFMLSRMIRGFLPRLCLKTQWAALSKQQFYTFRVSSRVWCPKITAYVTIDTAFLIFLVLKYMEELTVKQLIYFLVWHRALSSSAGVDVNSVWVLQAFTSVASLFLCVTISVFSNICALIGLLFNFWGWCLSPKNVPCILSTSKKGTLAANHTQAWSPNLCFAC